MSADLAALLCQVNLTASAPQLAGWLDRAADQQLSYADFLQGLLEEELAAGAWWALEAEEGDVFSPDPAQLWKRVLRRQGGALAITSAYPPDPSLN